MQLAGRDINLEQYFTADHISASLISELRRREPALWKRTELIVEPSVGSGSFLRAVGNQKRTIAFDIDPRVKGRNVHKKDFLTIKTDTFPKNTMCIGNPPFGKKSKLARQFINKCSEFSDHVFMILPVNMVELRRG